MKREIAMIAFVLLGMGMTASAQFGKKINLGKALQAVSYTHLTLPTNSRV